MKKREKKLAYCENCNKPLKGWNNKLYPIDMTSVFVPVLDIERWKEQGYAIKTEQ